ncbi:endonuclease [Blautia schinkii]|nr:endonuclease [Blautia schinkii]
MKRGKSVLKAIGVILGILILVLAAGVAYLTIREYRPDAEEKIDYQGGSRQLEKGSSLSVLTFNTGYGGLDASEDFFMDGGKEVRPDNKEQVEDNIAGITKVLQENESDVYFLQEVDRNSKRSYYIDEMEAYEQALGLNGAFACNFKCDYVPYPLPPIGKVESGLVSLSNYQVSDAKRISLPESFTWPVKTCNLKRCMLETRLPIEDSEKELVLINFHLEAYDDGEGKIAQSKMLADKLAQEYEKGNYVIAGGDFNQTFEMLGDKYPRIEEKGWAPGIISQDSLPEHFSFAVDDSYPTCRLLNQPYTGDYETSQVYVLDGFIVSDNLTVEEVKVMNEEFQYSDHQPVRLQVKLGD